MKENTMNNPSLFLRTWSWLKGFPSRHKIITALAVLFLVWQAIMTPIKNPFASDAITVRGRFPFDQGYELVFIQDAEGTAKWYRRRCGGSRVEEAVCTAGKTVLYPKKIDGQHYELTIYRDRYFRGLAGWEAGEGLLVTHFKAGIDRIPFQTGVRHTNRDMACDGSDAVLKEQKYRLFCTSLTNVKKYRDRPVSALPELPPDSKNEWVLNYWLESELDAMSAKEIKP